MSTPRNRRRTGCTECRRKKVKCNEQRPVCSRCSKFPRLCSYDLTVVQAKFAYSSAQKVRPGTVICGSSSPQTQDDGSSISSVLPPGAAVCRDLIEPVQGRLASTQNTHALKRAEGLLFATQQPSLSDTRITMFPELQAGRHRFFFQHFIAHTARTYFPFQPATVLTTVVPLAEEQPCMLDAMVAAGSLNHSRLKNASGDHSAAAAAALQSLSSLRRAITTAGAKNNAGTLAAALMLATTSLCSGDPNAYRQHLEGAIQISRWAGIQREPASLWSVSMKWLVQLLVMDRVARLSQPGRSRGPSAVAWQQLLKIAPEFAKVDLTTGFSLDLITILNDICDLADEARSRVATPRSSPENLTDGDLAECRGPTSTTNTFRVRSLEAQLHDLKHIVDLPGVPLDENVQQTELYFSHAAFTDAALICLYRHVDGLPRSHPKIQRTVDAVIESYRNIDPRSMVNTGLLWPLFTAACETITDAQRSFIIARLHAMIANGCGNPLKALNFMTDYWSHGAPSTWGLFAESSGLELILL